MSKPDLPSVLQPATQPVLPSEPGVSGSMAQFAMVWNNWLLSRAHNWIGTAVLMSSTDNPQFWQEALQLQSATVAQLQRLQTSWQQAWMAWLQDFPKLAQANTLSKLAEQQSDIFLQLMQMMAQRATDTMQLEENVSINYGYWLHQLREAEGLPGLPVSQVS